MCAHADRVCMSSPAGDGDPRQLSGLVSLHINFLTCEDWMTLALEILVGLHLETYEMH